MSESRWVDLSVAIVDEETVGRLKALMADVSEEGEDLARDLLETFRLDVERRLASFDGAIDRGDLDEAKEAVHALKGASATVGAPRVAALCLRLESALRAKEPIDGASAAVRATTDAALLALAARLRPTGEN